jgi:hypothetical protein
MDKQTQIVEKLTTAEVCQMLNAPGSGVRGRYRPGTHVRTDAGHRIQVSSVGEYEPLNKSREHARRLRQSRGRA